MAIVKKDTDKDKKDGAAEEKKKAGEEVKEPEAVDDVIIEKDIDWSSLSKKEKKEMAKKLKA